MKKYDPHWSYEREAACEEETEEYTIYCVKMYSQKWLDTSVWYSETHENSIWWHYQTIIVPKVRFFNDFSSIFSQILKHFRYSKTNKGLLLNFWEIDKLKNLRKVFSDDLGDKAYMQIEAGSNRNPPNIHDNEGLGL